jgi:hypothetical protein
MVQPATAATRQLFQLWHGPGLFRAQQQALKGQATELTAMAAPKALDDRGKLLIVHRFPR